MNPLDLKYCGVLSTRLQRYQVKQNSPYRANFRCYICGDSQKSRTKTRGWLLDKDNSAWYYCHNCGASMSLSKFLKQNFPALFNDYIADKILDKIQGSKKIELNQPKLIEPDRPLDKLTMKRPSYLKSASPLQQIRKVSSLKANHPVRKWLERRKIPTNKHHRLYFAPKFNKWSETVIPDKLNPKRDEARLVMPFVDQYGKLFGYSGRSFLPDAELRYLTMMIDEDMPKIYGLDVVDFERDYFVLEGQLDSLFVDNAVAMAGSSIDFRALENIHSAIFVFDNEPRNKEIVDKMKQVVAKGYRVVVWPKSIPTGYDVNDMIAKLGMTMTDVEMALQMGTCRGLQAELKIAEWNKVAA